MTINSNGLLTFDNGTSPAITGQYMDGGSGSIEGAWGVMPNVNSPGVIVFFPGGRYMNYSLNPDNSDCDGVTNPGGVEYGTYSYDGSTITGNVEVDENGYCGINNGTGSFTIPNVTVTGNQMTIIDTSVDGGTVTINRL
jgi:hypothetical protein